MPPSESLPSEQAAFAKHLFTQGYRLWSPDPVLLPAARQSVGLKIGDVGTVEELGRFDVFFNILEPPEGISDSLRLNFPPIVENDTRCLAQDLLRREVVSSPETSWDVDQLEESTVADISHRTTQYSATLSDDGAHIILPQGAQFFELKPQHRKLFESHAKEHGAEWLELFKDRLGWPRSNSLYLLTGFYKTCSWSIASFSMQTAANTNPVYVHCSLVEVDERTIQEDSVWHPAGRFKRKIGPPPDRQGQNNQTIFIRGITITPNVSQHGQTEDHRATSTLLSRLIPRIPFLNTLMGSNQERATQTVESNVMIQHIPPISQVSHPSEVINQYLLKKDPSARIAVTHDSQWISMLEMLGNSRQLEDLESNVNALVSEHYSIARHNGAVYLRDKEHQSPTHFAVEPSPLSSGMQLYEGRHHVVAHSGSSHDSDSRKRFEVEYQAPVPEVHTALQRKLKDRHVAMISIGGVIGAGLFIGTGPSLMEGPLGLFLAYIFVGTICYATMVSLGEMTAFLPLPGGFIKLAERFVDPAFAFATGWNHWSRWTLTLPIELSAAAVIINYWDKKTDPAIWITVCLVVVIAINALGVGAYGEAEFWFGSIKVITITGLIILGIIVDLSRGPDHDHVRFRYWKNPGLLTDYYGSGTKGHFLGTCSLATQVMFAYVGAEAVAMAAAETRSPRRTIPKAIKQIFFRVLLFYVGGVFVISLLAHSNSPSLGTNSVQGASTSPFVIAANAAGIRVLPWVINGAILTSAWSAGSSDLYLASRGLYGLAVSGSAPKIFSRTTSSGLPHVAVGVCSCFAFLAYLTKREGPGTVFSWFSGFSFTAGLVTWFGIGVTYLRFYEGLKAKRIDRKTLPFAPRVQQFAAWWCVCGSGLSLILSAWYAFLKGNLSTITFVTTLPIVFFPILYLAAKFVMHARPVKAKNMDFVTNVVEFDAMTYDDPPPGNWFEAFWTWLL